jgi:hypothetical protein
MDQATDTELLRALAEMIRNADVRVELDRVHLDKLDSPVSVQAESTRWLYALIVVCLAAAWIDWIAGAFAVAAGVALWLLWVQPDIARRLRARIETTALDDVATWRKLWRFGGLRLVTRDGGTICAAPQDNWMQFVRERVGRAGRP